MFSEADRMRNFLNDEIIHSALTPCQRFQGRDIKGKFLPIQIQFI